MLFEFQNAIQELSKQIPSWDDDVTKILSDEEHTDGNEVQKQSLDKFTELLRTIVKQANDNSVPVNEIISLFENYKCYKFASIYIKRKMQTFEGFKVLRDLEKKDSYKTKFCIDLIWSSYIVRYNPYLNIETHSPISENEYISVADRLDAFVDMCVVRQLCASAICKELEDETGLSNDVCQYMAKKIDDDFEKLKLNFIIENLTSHE